jgi:hypothetical protein
MPAILTTVIGPHPPSFVQSDRGRSPPISGQKCPFAQTHLAASPATSMDDRPYTKPLTGSRCSTAQSGRGVGNLSHPSLGFFFFPLPVSCPVSSLLLLSSPLFNKVRRGFSSLPDPQLVVPALLGRQFPTCKCPGDSLVQPPRWTYTRPCLSPPQMTETI